MNVKVTVDKCPSDHLAGDIAELIHKDLYDLRDASAEPISVDVYFGRKLYCSGRSR